MRKLIISILALGLICTVNTAFVSNQNEKLLRYTTAANQVVKDYNAENFSNIWNSFNQQLQNQIKCDVFIKSFKNLKLKLGNITSIDRTPNIFYNYYVFKAHFKKLDLYLYISLNDKNKFNYFTFLDHLPIVDTIKYPKVTDKTSIDELAKVYISQKVTAGLAIGIINNGKESTHFYGVVKKGTDIKPNKNTEYQIGSITKTFTAIALLEMQEQGLLNVNDSITKFLPKKIKTPSFNGKKITLESLVTQTSGLPRIPGNFFKIIENPQNPFTSYTVVDLYNFLNSYKLTRAVGSKYEYSNLGFGLLGHILAIKSGTSYGNVIKKEITDKLGMHDTYIKLSPEQKKNMSQGYSNLGKPVEIWTSGILDGCFAINSTITDMLIYLKANINKSDSILGKAIYESHQVKFNPKKSWFRQASGWIISKTAGKDVIWHDGETGGYSSFIGFFKGTKTGFVVLSNSRVLVDVLGMKILERLAMDLHQN